MRALRRAAAWWNPAGAMGRRWSGVEEYGLLYGEGHQRAHHDGGSMIVGWCHGGLEGAGICSLLGACWFGE